jgi:hypothetical protein
MLLEQFFKAIDVGIAMLTPTISCSISRVFDLFFGNRGFGIMDAGFHGISKKKSD